MDILPVVLICFILFGIGLKVAAHLDSPNRRWRRIAKSSANPKSPKSGDLLWIFPGLYEVYERGRRRKQQPDLEISDSEVDRKIMQAIDEESAIDLDLETRIHIYEEKIKLLREKLARTSSNYTDLIRSLTEENKTLWDQKLRDSEELIRLKQAMIEEEE